MQDSGGALCVGGPALVYYVTPTEEELFLVSNIRDSPLVRANILSAIQSRAAKTILGEPKRQARGFRPICQQLEVVLEER